MVQSKNGFIISTEKKILQLDRIHKFLSQDAYWCLGIPMHVLEKAIEGSLCFGIYEETSSKQVGFARVVTDNATFAWLCDIYVEGDYRGQGLSNFLMDAIMIHPGLKNLRRICLATKDAHSLYERFGFQITKTPSYWMEIKNNDIYKNWSEHV